MSHSRLRTGLILLQAVSVFPLLVVQGQQAPRSGQAETHTYVPARAVWSDSVVSRLKVPEGFRIEVFAAGLGGPRMLAVGEDGTVYVTRRDSGDVLALPPGGTGKADAPRKLVTGLPMVHGIAIDSGRIFLATVHEVYLAPLPRGGTGPLQLRTITDLPDGGGHPNRTLGIGPDRMLYISVGSTCNICLESSPEHATLLRSPPDGTERGVFARGLRNTVGWGWHPETRELWGVDNGSDNHGDSVPPEELNRLAAGGHYGWPFCHSDRKVDSLFPLNPRGSTQEEFCPRSVKPALQLDPHAAPIQLVFYRGSQFPSEYRGDAFVTLRGSWNRKQPAGYKVIRIRFEDGRPVGVEDFITGFLAQDGRQHFGRVAGLAVMRDGSLLVGDDTNGVIYRVSHSVAAGSAPNKE